MCIHHPTVLPATLALIIYGVFGLGLFAAPAQFMTPFGAAPDPASILMSRIFGVALLSSALIFWWIRASALSDALIAIFRANCIYNVGAILLVLLAITAGTINEISWVLIVVQAVLAVGLGYYGFVATADD